MDRSAATDSARARARRLGGLLTLVVLVLLVGPILWMLWNKTHAR